MALNGLYYADVPLSNYSLTFWLTLNDTVTLTLVFRPQAAQISQKVNILMM